MAFAAATDSNRPTMTDRKDKREGQTAAAGNPRQDRLKRALRENLKRRKSQARGRSDPASAPSNADPVSPYDESEKKPGE
jgi:hypothetical protein